MKKATVWLLLIVFLVNIIGFRLSYLLLEKNADVRFNQNVLNRNYNINELIKIDIPNPIPYTKSQKNYKRVNGETTYKNKVYKYVYLKIKADTISILCLPDEAKGEIKKLHKKYETASNESEHNTGKSVVKISLSDFLYTSHQFNIKLFARELNLAFIKPLNWYIKVHLNIPQLPPENQLNA